MRVKLRLIVPGVMLTLPLRFLAIAKAPLYRKGSCSDRIAADRWKCRFQNQKDT
jgi:hypothetical protein